MNARDILLDLDAAISKRWPIIDDCTQLAEIVWLSDEIAKTKKNIKELKKQKQQITSKFKESREQSELASLKKDMQQISSQLKSQEDQRKKFEAELVNFFAIEEKKPQFPSRFLAFANSNPVSNSVNLVFSTTVEAERWDNYVNQHPQATAYHAYAWKSVIEKSFNHKCVYLAALNGENIVGVLPLVAFKHPVFGCFAVSVPFFNYGGPLADSPDTAAALLTHAEVLKSEFNWEHIEVRTCNEHFTLPSESRKASMILALPDSMQTLENQLGTKVRAQYKITEKAQPTIHFGGLNLLDDYYKVFAHNMRDLGTPVYSKAFFENILQQFQKQATIVVARINNKPMGAAFLFGYKDLLEIPWASTLKKANRHNLNMWMYKNILQFAIANKYDYFDFGRSTIDAGTYKFKKQWGAQPLKHYWYYILNDGQELPKINPDNPKYKLAIGVWKKLPVFITKLIGPPLVKHIP